MGQGPRRPLAHQPDVWAQEKPRALLLAPVAMAAGAAAQLAAVVSAPLWAAATAVVLGFGAAAVIWAWPTPRLGPWAGAARFLAALACALVAAFALGVAAVAVKAGTRPQTTLAAPVEAALVEGFIVDHGRSGDRLRLTLQLTRFEAEGHVGPPPRRVRVSLSEDAARFLRPGRHVRCRADLAPPSPPLAPGTYDFQRRAFFEGLDGVGFTRGRCRPAAGPAAPADLRFTLWLGAVRADLASAITAAAPGQGGAVAAAMTVGDLSAMTAETTLALQNSGLAHIISVSGLHMAVVGGFVFFLVKRGLALVPFIALRIPVAKLAAAAALTALVLYLLLSGSSVPAQRAAVMAGVAFGAVLVDRPAISMRGLGLAAAVIILLEPEAVVEPGFQMSFAATMALVAAFENLARREGPQGSPGPMIGGLQTFGRAMTGAVVTSGVAGLATELFALQHFQRLTLYGLPVNLAAAPIIAFVVAPAAVVAAVAAPFGLADPALQVMAAALDVILAFAGTFATRPEAVQPAAPLSPSAFLAFAAALVCLCLWRGPLRWTAMVFAAIGVAAQAVSGPVVAVFDGGLHHVYVRSAERPQALALSGGWQGDFERERLLALMGLSPEARSAVVEGASCGKRQCVQARRGDMLFRLYAAGKQPGDPPVLVMTAAGGGPGRVIRGSPDRGGVVRSGPFGLSLHQPGADWAERPWRQNAGRPSGS